MEQRITAPTSTIPEAPAPQPSNRAALLIVFIVVFIDLLGFAIVLPLLPIIGDVYVKPLSNRNATTGRDHSRVV